MAPRRPGMSAPRQAAHSDKSSSSVAPAHGAGTAGWVVGLSLFAGGRR